MFWVHIENNLRLFSTHRRYAVRQDAGNGAKSRVWYLLKKVEKQKAPGAAGENGL